IWRIHPGKHTHREVEDEEDSRAAGGMGCGGDQGDRIGSLLRGTTALRRGEGHDKDQRERPVHQGVKVCVPAWSLQAIDQEIELTRLFVCLFVFLRSLYSFGA